VSDCVCALSFEGVISQKTKSKFVGWPRRNRIHTLPFTRRGRASGQITDLCQSLEPQQANTLCSIRFCCVCFLVTRFRQRSLGFLFLRHFTNPQRRAHGKVVLLTAFTLTSSLSHTSRTAPSNPNLTFSFWSLDSHNAHSIFR
jgi:hypothetical protein